MDVTFDRQEQYDQIASGLLDGERVIAVYDAAGGGTGFIGITDRRVIVQDKSFVGKRTAITSIPYNRVTSVSVVSDRSWAGRFFSSSTIAISTSGRSYEMQFRGDEKAHHVHDVVLERIS